MKSFFGVSILPLLSILFFMQIMVTGCDEEDIPPIACLRVTDNMPATGEVVTFSSCSEDEFRIEIDFGDGTFAKSAPVDHSYAEEGTYIATLYAWSENGDFKSKSIQLMEVGADTSTNNPNPNPGELPTPCFTPSSLIVESGVDVQFINCSLNASSFSWDFGDGNNSTMQNPMHAFSGSGSFDVTLTATNSEGSADTTITITVGQRKLTNVRLLNFDPLNPSGVAWDDFGFPIPGFPTEPDVFIEIISTSGATLNTAIESNLEVASLPITWDMSSDNLILSSDTWSVTIYDDEGFQGSPEEMYSWSSVDLGTLGSGGEIEFTDGSWRVILEYIIQ